MNYSKYELNIGEQSKFPYFEHLQAINSSIVTLRLTKPLSNKIGETFCEHWNKCANFSKKMNFLDVFWMDLWMDVFKRILKTYHFLEILWTSYCKTFSGKHVLVPFSFTFGIMLWAMTETSCRLKIQSHCGNPFCSVNGDAVYFKFMTQQKLFPRKIVKLRDVNPA